MRSLGAGTFAFRCPPFHETAKVRLSGWRSRGPFESTADSGAIRLLERPELTFGHHCDRGEDKNAVSKAFQAEHLSSISLAQ